MLTPLTLRAGPLTLRPFEVRDVPAIVEAGRDPLIPLITTVPAGCDEVGALAFIGRQHERLHTGAGWSLAIAEGDAPTLGHIGLWPRGEGRASLGYWLARSARGRGVATQALLALSRFGLKEFERLELFVEPRNEASWRAAERVGFVREGLLRSYLRVGPERQDMFVYGLLPGELRENPSEPNSPRLTFFRAE